MVGRSFCFTSAAMGKRHGFQCEADPFAVAGISARMSTVCCMRATAGVDAEEGAGGAARSGGVSADRHVTVDQSAGLPLCETSWLVHQVCVDVPSISSSDLPPTYRALPFLTPNTERASDTGGLGGAQGRLLCACTFLLAVSPTLTPSNTTSLRAACWGGRVSVPEQRTCTAFRSLAISRRRRRRE